jgi:hypothetical protein
VSYTGHRKCVIISTGPVSIMFESKQNPFKRAIEVQSCHSTHLVQKKLKLQQWMSLFEHNNQNKY